MSVWSAIRLCWALALLGLGLLAVCRVPHGILWKPAVAATEWGHLLALAALVPLLGWPGDLFGRLAALAAAFGALLLLTPTLRARPVARAWPARFEAAFGRLPPAPPPLPGTPEVRQEAYLSADGAPLPLDLYLPPSPPEGGAPRPREGWPVLVTVHGGSWSSGDRKVLPALNAHLAQRGWAVVAINYRLAPAHRFPAARDDVLAAVAWVKEQAGVFGLDPGRIVLHGRSAGGHLVLSAAYHAKDPALRGVIALYPPTDLHWSWENPGSSWIIDTPGTLRGFLGGEPAQNHALYGEASPIRYAAPGSPPTLLLHGGRDELVWPEQSRRLAAVLEREGVPHLLVELPWATHGLDANLSGPGGRISTAVIERFLAAVTR